MMRIPFCALLLLKTLGHFCVAVLSGLFPCFVYCVFVSCFSKLLIVGAASSTSA